MLHAVLTYLIKRSFISGQYQTRFAEILGILKEIIRDGAFNKIKYNCYSKTNTLGPRPRALSKDFRFE